MRTRLIFAIVISAIFPPLATLLPFYILYLVIFKNRIESESQIPEMDIISYEFLANRMR